MVSESNNLGTGFKKLVEAITGLITEITRKLHTQQRNEKRREKRWTEN
jgi:hypothetical protein